LAVAVGIDSKPVVRPEDIRRAAAEKQAEGKEFMTFARAVVVAGEHFNAGRLEQAEKIARQVLAQRPDNADAHNILSAVFFRNGQVEEALHEVREAIRLNGSIAAFHANRGEMERRAGNLDAAERSLLRAIKLQPRSAQAHNNLGIVYFDLGKYPEAETSYRQAVELTGGKYAEAYNNLGNVLRALGKPEEAIECYEQAIDRRSDYPEAYNNLGSALRDLRRFDQAEMSYDRAISLKANYLEAMENMATLLIGQERYEDALRQLAEVLKVDANRVSTLVLVARAQLARHSLRQAESALKSVLRQKPENVEALTMLGQICHEQDRFEESVAAYEAALKVQPDNVETLNMLGVALKSVGRMDDARAMLRRAIELQPNAPGTYSNIADLEKFTPDHPLLATMEGFLARDNGQFADRFISIHFALGKAYDDMGQHEKALEHFANGAARKRAQLDYDERETTTLFEDIMKVFGEEYFSHRPFEGNPTEVPIFIVGMPRSGSTLTEQILASHPAVYGAGEIKTLTIALGQLRMRYPNIPKYPHAALSMKPAQFASLAQSYLQTITAPAGGAARITDKLLSNFYFVGLINTLFPRARIIHTMRNPIDTCLSTFTKLFKDEMSHSYDLAELGRYYRLYEKMMAHWRRVLPEGAMLDIVYEDVVADTEAKAREMIAFCGLEWDDRCLAFHETQRPVKTASVSQVRKPLYGTSVARWRRYGDRLKPLIEALGLDENGQPLEPPAAASN
jgi:tetratricopeptide (TPR) repeat protein